MDMIYKPFGVPFAEDNPEIEIYNIMDDTLLKDTLANGGITNAVHQEYLTMLSQQLKQVQTVLCVHVHQ